MNLDRWPEITEEFDRLRELSPDERHRALDKHDVDLRAAVLELLAAPDACEDSCKGFLEKPVLLAWHPLTGRRLGHFQLIRQIGEGGMGTVFEAERADDSFSQRVAVKIVRRGRETEFNLDRFRRERQILANLNHPNIARLFDGGATEDGAPYLVMELIEGEHIDKFCESRNLRLDARLRLMQTVCAAVHHAHQRHVVHRDLKPGNILVTADGVPKLLDFGIAKSFDPNTPAESTHTQRMASPHYASPEQLRGAEVTAATDIYSLGVILLNLTGGSAALDPVIRKAMAADPGSRYASAADLSAALGGVLAAGRDPAPIRRVSQLAAAATVLWLAFWLVWTTSAKMRQSAGSPAGATPSLAVAQFENLSGDASLDWLARGMPELLTTGLAQSAGVSGGFEVLSTDRLRAVMQRSPNPVEVARDSKATLFVSGAVMRRADDAGVRVGVRVQETASGKVVYAGRFEGSGENGIFAVADQAASAIAAGLGKGRATAAPDVAKILTANPAALQAYFEGLRWYDRFRFPEARAAFDRATALDPDFILAYLMRANMAAHWNPAAARHELAIAAKISETHPLPLFEQRLLQARMLHADGRLDDWKTAAEALTRDFPKETQPLAMLTEYHLTVGDWPNALRAAQAATAIDPKDPQLVFQLLAGYQMTGDLAAAHRQAARYCELVERGDWNCPDVSGDLHAYEQRWDEALADYAKYRGKWNQSILKPVFVSILRGAPGDHDRAEQLARIAPSEYPKQPATPAISEFLLGNLDAARGRLRDAAGHFEASAKLYSNPAFRFYQLWKATQIHLEQNQPRNLLELAARNSNSQWGTGLRAIALEALGDRKAAEHGYIAMRAALSPLYGAYMARGYERLCRLQGAFQAGDHQAVIDHFGALPVQLRQLGALAAGRSYLALGRHAEARIHLQRLYDARLLIGVPTLYEQYDTRTFERAGAYLAEMAGRSTLSRSSNAATGALAR